MNKNSVRFLVFAIVSVFFFSTLQIPLSAESGIYDRIGIFPEHGSQGSGEESINYFNGNLTLKFLDVHLPGPNGFDLNIWRIYNSKLLEDNTGLNLPQFNQEPVGWVGLGWSLHMGRVHLNAITQEQYIEFPDGRCEIAYLSKDGTCYMTKNLLKFVNENNTLKLYFPDGTVWLFEKSAIIFYDNFKTGIVHLVTQIIDSYGHKIIVEYHENRPTIKKITDSLNRVVTFVVDNENNEYPKLKEIQVKDAHGNTSVYTYTVDSYDNYIMNRLSKFKPPLLPESTYLYNSADYEYELKEIKTSYGGTVQYKYDYKTFYFYEQPLQTRVVTEKHVQFSEGASFNSWYFSYPAYQNYNDRTVTITGPEYTSWITYYAHTPDSPGTLVEKGWTTGLIQKKWLDDDSYSEEYEWTPEEITSTDWMVLGYNVGKIKAPLISKIIKTGKGDAESTEEHLYERTDTKKYGLPTKIKYYGGINGTTLRNSKTLEYFYETNSTFRSKYMLNYIKDETTYDSGLTRLKEVETNYYTGTGNCGAIDYISQWRTGNEYLTWDYGYSSSNPNDITITIDLPGSSGTETYYYQYGTLANIIRPGYTELTRNISSYNSAILSETNQHNGTMNFTYDNLNRVTFVDMPTGFNDINVTWNTNSVSISQGGNTVNKYWDGMGRDTGYTESGDSTTLYYRKNLDAESRVDSENKGSTNSSHKFTYQRNDTGSPTSITDPRGKTTNIVYYDDLKIVTDAENHQTSFYYHDLPGLVTNLKDAFYNNAYYTYDYIGRLLETDYYNSRTQSYQYNGLDQVTSEEHPETGQISYTYNPENNLWTKTWGGVTHTYTYNTSNQLKQIDANDEVIDYTYDTNGRVQSISSNKGWTRDQMTYNKLGSLLTERQTIPGLAAKNISYDYDNNNNLKFIGYPDGRSVNTANNGLNMPETLSFNSKMLISQIAYGTAKQPTSMTILGNNTTFSASYYENGALDSLSLKKGTTTHFKGVYGYDNVGNITSISSTIPSLNVNCTYDNLYRLTYASYYGGKYYEYSHDYWGNLENARQSGTTVFNQGYNTKNQFSSSSYDYDNRGNLTIAPGFQYVWDNQNRLITNKLDTGEIIANHVYNEQGLRVKSSKVPSPSISILTPAPGQIWNKNATYAITWTITGLMDEYVKILLMQGETQVLEIINSTENDGLYDWTIPITVQNGEYSISVQTVDNQISGLSELFFISGTNTINSFTEITSGEIVADITDSTGAAWADYDNDDDLDLFVANFNQNNFLFKNNGSGYFTKILSGSIVTDVNNSQYGSWGDYDNDGDLDLFVPNYDQNNCLYMNNGNQTFTKVSAGVSGPGKSFGSAWGDYDNDGWLDLFVANYNQKNFLYKNNKNGTFTKITSGSIVNDIENSTSGNWCDYDNDNDLDLFVTNYDESNSLYQNNGDGTFTKITSGEIVNDAGKSYGSAWGDFDNDGDFDLFVNNRENQNNFFYKNNNNGTFTKIIGIDPVIDGGNSYKANWGDFDNDGDLDLFVLNAFADNFLYQNNGDSTFTKITAAAMVPNLDDSRGKSWGDYDHDGDLDLFIAKYNTNNALFLNNGNSNSWIMIKCMGNSSNRAGIGAKVKVKAALNGAAIWQIREINERLGLYAAFGLGDASIIAEIQVEWPSGIIQTLNNISINQYLTITEPEQKSITVTLPNGGEILEVGAANEIKWNSTGAITSVDIEYSTDNGTSWTNIITSTANDNIYEWIVPDTQSNNCLIKIIESGGTTSDTSDAVFVIATVVVPTITITSPNGGEAWEIESIHNITWTSAGGVGNVRILYSLTNGVSWYEIIASTENDGIYYWTLPGIPSDNCLVRISEIDGDPMDTSDNVFSITGPQPASITVTSPNGGEIWEIGSIHNITWTSSGSVGMIKIEYSTNNGTSWTIIVSSTTNDGTYSWTVPDIVATGCLIRISEIDGEPLDTSDAVFSIIETPVTITVTSPNGGETLEVGYSHNITWSSTGALSLVKIEYSTNNGTSWTTIVSQTTNSGSFSWTIPDIPSVNCLVRIGDTDGNPVDTSNEVFTIAAPDPDTITVISPYAGDVWEVGSAHNITWTSTGTIENVKIEYATHGSSYSRATIVNSTINDGIYKWIVPDNIITSHLCVIIISDANVNNDTIDFSNYFTIAPHPFTCGESWEIIDIEGILYDVVYGDHVLDESGGPIFVAVGANGLIMTSPDGIYWDHQVSGTNDHLKGISYRFSSTSSPSNLFIAVGNNGRIISSASGITWDNETSGTTIKFNGITYGTGWMAVGDNGNTYFSLFGDSWKKINSGTSVHLKSVTYKAIDILYEAVGNNGVIIGNQFSGWHQFQTNFTFNLNDISYGEHYFNDKFVAVGDNGKIVSTMNYPWDYKEQSSGTTKKLHSVAYGDYNFVSVGANGIILTSRDGIEWTQQYSGTTKTLYGVGYGNGRFVAVGDDIILCSVCNPAFETPAINITTPNGGENCYADSTYYITWNSEGDVGNVAIEYSIDNGTTWTTIVSATPNDGSYSWTVPYTPSDSCLIRISDSNGEPSDVSDAVFSIIIKPKITVTSPNGGEHWAVGSSRVISWTSEGNIDTVKIEYSMNNGSNWTGIIDAAENDGTFAWTVPGTPSINCLVRVSEVNGTASDTSDNVFSILLPSPITITSPNGGEAWEAGSNHNITWACTGSFENVKIEYSINSGTSWQKIADFTPNDGTYSWTVPDTPSDKCLVQISILDSNTDEYPPDISDALFSIITNASSCGKTWKNSSYSGSDGYKSVTYGSTQFAAVGQDGVIMTGIDGMSWTSQTSGTTNHLNGIAYGNNTFTAVGDNGLILTSPDGITWTSQTPGTSQGLQGILYAGNMFIAVGVNGVLLTSPDSINWTSRSPGTSDTLFDITYNSNTSTFAVAGANGTILTSPDAINWTKRSPGITKKLYSIAWGDNQFVAVGENGIILTSNNGINWNSRTSSIQTDLFQVIYDHSTFVIVGKYGEILTGYDGINWTNRDPGVNCDLYGIAYGNSRFVTVGTGIILYSLCPPESPGITLTSPNGRESWSVGSTHNITWTHSGNVGNVIIDYSTDNGNSWTGIISSTVNDGSHPWNIPDTPSDLCRVRISETDGDPADASDTVFAIITGPEPTITLTSPNGGETLFANTSHEITWDSTGNVIDVNIEYSIDIGSTWLTVAASISNNGSYDWTVPHTPSAHCLVRISADVKDLQPTDTSDAVFEIVTEEEPTITVTSPNGRETLTVRTVHEINWTTIGTVGEVKIEYSTDNGSSWTGITPSTPNDGSFSWTVPDTPANDCLVRISENDEDGMPSDMSDAVFSIVTSTSSGIIVTSPNGGETWEIGSIHEITWTSTGMVGDVNIKYSIDNGFNWIEIIQSTANDSSHGWTIPNTPSESSLIRISKISGDIFDTSNAVFSIVLPAAITITAPNGGETLEAGSNYSINWQSSGTVKDVNLEYSTDNEITWKTIVNTLSNQGTYNWLVPDDPSNNCLVRIKDSNKDTGATDVSDAVFSIVTPSTPVINITSPNGGETLTAGTSYHITWATAGTIENVKIQYSVDSGANWIEIVNTITNEGSYQWNVPDNPSGTCLVRVSDIDDEPFDTSDAEFSIIPPPVDNITIISPNGGETINSGTTYDITWTTNGTIETVNIEYSTDNSFTWKTVVTSTANDGTYTWTVPDTPSDNCLVKVYTNDEDKEPSDISDAVFSIVSEPVPSITVISPNGSEGWEISSMQTITWTSTGTIDNVTIEYSINSGTSWIEIITSTPNTGSYEWTIPDSPSIYCLVRISEADIDTGPSDTSDSYFSIISETFDCGEKWTGSYSGNKTLNEITYGNSKFVTVGPGGTIMTGNGKTAWTSQSSGTTKDLHGITWGNNIFVTVGKEGTTLTSPNGTTWTTQSPVTNKDLNHVAYGGNQFIAVGNQGTILTSPNGITWGVQSSGITTDLYGIAYGSDKFTAVGKNGIILTSSNGIDWTKRNLGITQTLYDIVYGNNQFLAVGAEGVIITSTNGINWNLRTAGVNTSLLGAAYGNSIFVIVGQNGKILTGTDQTGWEVRDSHVRENLNGTAFGNSLFAAVGAGNILYSLCNTTSSTANMMNGLPKMQKLLPKLANNFPNDPEKIAREVSLQLISPQGSEVLHPGEKSLITWKSSESIENVKLEYSPDNGTTYLEIINNFMPPAARGDSFWKKPSPLDPPAKTFDYFDDIRRNYYEWQVPHHISANCLIRISEKKEKKTPLQGLWYELNFKITGNKLLTNTGEIFSIYPGDAANQAINHTIPRVFFSIESNGKTYIHWNEATKEIGRLTGFLDRWHNIRIIMDNAYDQVSVILDGAMLFESIPGAPMAVFSPAISFAVGPNNTTNTEIDDVIVQALYLQEENIKSETDEYKNRPSPYKGFPGGRRGEPCVHPAFSDNALGSGPLFTEDFERLNEKNSLENNGWRTKSEHVIEGNQKQSRKSVFVNLNPALASKTLKMQTVPGNRVIAVKYFDIPVDFPFDVSDKPFEIRYNNGMTGDTAVHDPVDIYPGVGGYGTSVNYYYSAPAAAFNSSSSTPDRVQDTTLVDTYYIYSYDGKLLAEYDHNGNCVKDYIYAGNRLIAEYYPSPIDKYYYYMPDQVNSVRIVTDGNGEVVYSAAYGPYGEIEKVWNDTYKPKLKFSGKERDEYTELDYFGARYYDHNHYRFNSVDPVINKEESLYNPQLWNLYAYCRNNPITFLDPEGRQSENEFGWFWIQHKIIQEGGEEGIRTVQGMNYLVGMASAGMSAAIVGYFAGPEIIASMVTASATLKKWGTKAADFVSKFFKGNSSINYNRLFEALSKNNLRHISKHLSEFQKYDPNMTLRNLVDLGHKIISNTNNLIATPGGREVFEETVEIGSKSLIVRAVLNTAGKLNSVQIR